MLPNIEEFFCDESDIVELALWEKAIRTKYSTDLKLFKFIEVLFKKFIELFDFIDIMSEASA